jgi:hypothetical protein
MRADAWVGWDFKPIFAWELNNLKTKFNESYGTASLDPELFTKR